MLVGVSDNDKCVSVTQWVRGDCLAHITSIKVVSKSLPRKSLFTRPTLLNSTLEGFMGGIVVHDHTTGQFVQNEIMRNTMAGVGDTDYACPVFHSNIVKDGKGGGIVLHEHCKGVFEKNQVIGNTHTGIGLKGSCNALMATTSATAAGMECGCRRSRLARYRTTLSNATCALALS